MRVRWRFAITLLLVGCRPEAGSMLGASSCSVGRPGSLVVAPAGLRAERGEVLCALFSSEAGFPTDAAAAVANDVVPVGPDGACCEFDELAPGEYAVAVLHDEDGDGKLTTSGVGIPREGFAASNDAKPRGASPPRYADASFDLDGRARLMPVTMRYIGSGRRAPTAGSVEGFVNTRGCRESDLVGVGFRGPAWDAAQSRPIGEPRERYLVHTTVLHLRNDPAALATFRELNAEITAALEEHPGLVGYDLAVSDRCHTARTFAVWTDEAAMTSFAFGDETHTKAMAYFTRVATGGRTAHFTMPASALPPSWDDMAARVARAPEVIR